MKSRHLTLTLLCIIAFIGSCNTANEVPKGKYSSGILIINEGNFSQSNGSISFFNEQSTAVTSDVYKEANNVSPGGILQSVYFGDEFAYIIDQLGNLIHVVNAETFESVAVINQGLSTPRYMVELNGKAYVSNWGPFDNNYDLPNSFVAIIDLSSFEVIKTITSGKGAEGLTIFGEKIYVANSYGSSIDIIDPKNESIIGSIDVAAGPQTFVEDKNGKHWVLSSSYATGSSISQLDLSSQSVLKSFAVAESAKSLNINGAGDALFYLSAPYGSDAEVHQLYISASEDSQDPLIISPNLYGLGVHPTTGMIYLGNHNAFQGNGTIIRYQGNEFMDSFAAGVAPNGFVFRP